MQPKRLLILRCDIQSEVNGRVDDLEAVLEREF